MLTPYKLHSSEFQGVVAEYNTVVKLFPDGTKHLRYTSYSNLKGLSRNTKHNGTSSEEELQRYNTINLIRRRQSISDLAYANGCIVPWEYFVTLTFDDEVVGDSYSHEKVTEYLHKWLDNQKHQNPNMRYLLVPELHESGRIHFHGIFSYVPNWNLVQAFNPHTGKPIIQNGTIIYNLSNYDLGFTTVSEVKSLECVSRYISKYITKELLNLKNKKNVWHSKNLIKPKQTFYLSDISEINDFLSDKDISFIQEKDTESYFKKFICINK